MSESEIDPARCPLCGQPNQCPRVADHTYKGPCWCAEERISAELLSLVPDAMKNRACLCRECIRKGPYAVLVAKQSKSR